MNSMTPHKSQQGGLPYFSINVGGRGGSYSKFWSLMNEQNNMSYSCMRACMHTAGVHTHTCTYTDNLIGYKAICHS